MRTIRSSCWRNGIFRGLLGDVHGLDVVDLGCGTGRHSIRLVAAGARVTAVDFSDGMVAKARRKPGWEQVQFILHDLTRGLPFSDCSFDRVLSCLVLDHVGDQTAFFAECRRICRPEGFVLVSISIRRSCCVGFKRGSSTRLQGATCVRPVRGIRSRTT